MSKKIALTIIVAALILTSANRTCAAWIYQDDFNIPIPYNTDQSQGPMLDLAIVVQKNIIVEDINVTVDITHQCASDLLISLIAPDGTTVNLTDFDNQSNIGGQNFQNCTFNDQAKTSINSANPPFTGEFKPAHLLEKFNGSNACGTWYLKIYDTASLNTGTLDYLKLSINTPEPSSFLLLLTSTLAIALKRKKTKRN